MIESLESRQLYSGVVTVTTNYGQDHGILVEGDDATNEVAFFAGFSNGYEEEASTNSLAVYGGRLIVDGVEIPGGKNSDPYITNYGAYPPR